MQRRSFVFAKYIRLCDKTKERLSWESGNFTDLKPRAVPKLSRIPNFARLIYQLINLFLRAERWALAQSVFASQDREWGLIVLPLERTRDYLYELRRSQVNLTSRCSFPLQNWIRHSPDLFASLHCMFIPWSLHRLLSVFRYPAVFSDFPLTHSQFLHWGWTLVEAVSFRWYSDSAINFLSLSPFISCSSTTASSWLPIFISLLSPALLTGLPSQSPS